MLQGWIERDKQKAYKQRVCLRHYYACGNLYYSCAIDRTITSQPAFFVARSLTRKIVSLQHRIKYSLLTGNSGISWMSTDTSGG